MSQDDLPDFDAEIEAMAQEAAGDQFPDVDGAAAGSSLAAVVEAPPAAKIVPDPPAAAPVSAVEGSAAGDDGRKDAARTRGAAPPQAAKPMLRMGRRLDVAKAAPVAAGAAKAADEQPAKTSGAAASQGGGRTVTARGASPAPVPVPARVPPAPSAPASAGEGAVRNVTPALVADSEGGSAEGAVGPDPRSTANSLPKSKPTAPARPRLASPAVLSQPVRAPAPTVAGPPEAEARRAGGTTAFGIFSGEERARIKGEMPKASPGDVQKEVGRRFRALGADERAQYEARAREARESGRGGGPGAAARKPALPPKTTFQLFCADLRPSVEADNPRAGPKEVAQLLVAAWREASEEDRAVYEARHAELRKEAAGQAAAEERGGDRAVGSRPRPPRKRAAGKRGRRPPPDPEHEREEASDQQDLASEDEEARRSCDWEAHPPLFILSEDRSRDAYLVARHGLPLTDYGIVSASAAKRARHGEAGSILPLELLEKWDAFQKRFQRDLHRRQDEGELDLEELPSGSALEACALLGLLREGGRELASKGKNDVWMRVPLLATCRVIQWLLENATKGTWSGAGGMGGQDPDDTAAGAITSQLDGGEPALVPSGSPDALPKPLRSAAAASAREAEP